MARPVPEIIPIVKHFPLYSCEGNNFNVDDVHLGTGAIAHVYRCTRMADGRHFALKIPRQPGQKSNWDREIDITRNLSNPVSPNVMAFITWVKQPRPAAGIPSLRGRCMVLEQCDRDLFDITANATTFAHLPVGVMMDIVCQIFRGMAHIHQRGYVHQDISMANIMIVASEGRVKLTDFGETRRNRPRNFPNPGQAQRSDLRDVADLIIKLITGYNNIEGMMETCKNYIVASMPQYVDAEDEVEDAIDYVYSYYDEFFIRNLFAQDGDDWWDHLQIICPHIDELVSIVLRWIMENPMTGPGVLPVAFSEGMRHAMGFRGFDAMHTVAVSAYFDANIAPLVDQAESAQVFAAWQKA